MADTKRTKLEKAVTDLKSKRGKVALQLVRLGMAEKLLQSSDEWRRHVDLIQRAELSGMDSLTPQERAELHDLMDSLTKKKAPLDKERDKLDKQEARLKKQLDELDEQFAKLPRTRRA